MKTILEQSTKVSVYIFDDTKTITLRANSIVIGDPVEFVIWDLNEYNAEVITGVTPPTDWRSRKYKYNEANGVWSENPDWDTWKEVQDEALQDILDSKVNISSYTDQDILDKIMRVDGDGSGLDADLLDGQDGSYYLPSSQYTAADILSKLLTADGIGSGLDADVLDGKQGSYYLDPTNISAYIPASKLNGLYGINISGNANTATALQTPREISLSGDVTGSVTFDGTLDKDIVTTLEQFNMNVDANHNRITNLDNPIALQDATNKQYVDNLVSNAIQLLDRGKSYYVATEGTDDVTCGKTPATPFKTIKYACERVAAEQAEAGEEFRAAIHIGVGAYLEQLPIVVPPFTALVGDTQRSTVVRPADGYSEGYEVESFTASDGQTDFYTDTQFDDIKVYKNSTLLTEGVDYNIHRKKIVLTAPCTIADSVILNCYTLNKNNTMFKMSNGTLAIKILTVGMGGWSNEDDVSFYSSNNTVYLEEHGFVDGDLLRIVTANTEVGDLENKHVYVLNGTGDSDHFQISAVVDGDPIEFSADGEGVIEDSDLSNSKPRGIVYALNADSPIVTTSPYILECANISTYISGGGRGIGAYIDGKATTSAGDIQTLGTKSMLFHAFTNIIDDGCGFWCDNGGVVELVSCFTYYCKYGYASTRGGYIRSLNGSNSWGVRALYSSGYLQDEVPITSTIIGEQFYYSYVEAVSNTELTLDPGDYIFSNTENNAIGTLISNQPLEKKFIYVPIQGQFDYEEEVGSPFTVYANSDVEIVGDTPQPIAGREAKYKGDVSASATIPNIPVSYQHGRSIAIYNLQRYNPETGLYELYDEILKEGASITMNDIVGYDIANNIISEENSYVIQSIKEGGTEVAERYDAEANTTVEFDSNVYILGLVQNKEYASLPGWTATMRYKFSQVRCSGHDLLDIGTGNWDTTNLYDPDLPSRSANSELEVSEFAPGRVFYVTTDQDGNFKVGNYFEVNQGTGQIYLDASVFELATVESFDVGILTIGGANPVNGVSVDVELSENSNVLLSTQRAIKTYVDTEIQAVDDRNLDYEESNLYPINIAHNANTATALETPRYINLTNDVSGEVVFDGTSNADIEVTANYGPTLLLGRDITEDHHTNKGILVNWDNKIIDTIGSYVSTGSSTITGVFPTTSEITPAIGDIVDISGAIGTEEEKLNGRWDVIGVSTDGANTLVDFIVSDAIAANTYTSNIGEVYIAHSGFFGVNATTGYWDYIPHATKDVSVEYPGGPEITTYEGNRGTLNVDIIGNSVDANTIVARNDLSAYDAVISHNLSVYGDLLITGSTIQADIQTIQVEDPTIEVGLSHDSNNDILIYDGNDRRGVEFWYNTTEDPKSGFFGYDPSEDLFKFLSIANSSTEIKGTIDAHIQYEDILNTPNTWISFTDGVNTATPDTISDTFTFVAGNGLTVAVSSASDNVTYDHYQPSTSDLTEWHRTYVTGLTYDDYGHITGYTTNTEHVLDTTYVLNVLDPIGANNNVRIELAGTDGNTSSSDIVTIEGDDNIVITKSGETVIITAPDVDTTINNDTTDTTQYLVSARQTSGAFTEGYVSNTNLYFNPSTGTLTATDFDSLSDARLKDNVKELSNTINILDQLVPVEFTWKDSGARAFGMIAQEVEKVIPEIVHESTGGIKSVGYTQIIPFLVETVKKQQKEIDEMKETIKNLT